LTARILFAVILFLVNSWRPTLAVSPHPLSLDMLDDLVQYCLTEIAYEGELGTRLVFLDRVTQIRLAAGSNRSMTVY
jgi:hypothetical protein